MKNIMKCDLLSNFTGNTPTHASLYAPQTAPSRDATTNVVSSQVASIDNSVTTSVIKDSDR